MQRSPHGSLRHFNRNCPGEVLVRHSSFRVESLTCVIGLTVLIQEGPASSATRPEHCFLGLYDCSQVKIGILLRRLGLHCQFHVGDRGTCKFCSWHPIDGRKRRYVTVQLDLQLEVTGQPLLLAVWILLCISSSNPYSSTPRCLQLVTRN